MTGPTPTERAVELLANAVGYGEDYDAVFRASLQVLAENPDLLVDLAIEAGGLEQVGWTNPLALHLKQWWDTRDNDGEVRVLCDRRTTTEASDEELNLYDSIVREKRRVIELGEQLADAQLDAEGWEKEARKAEARVAELTDAIRDHADVCSRFGEPQRLRQLIGEGDE